MANSDSNARVDLYNTIDTAPTRYSTKTGHYHSAGQVVFGDGVTTKFTTELEAYGWLFNGTNEVRKIKSILDDQTLYLDRPFTVDLPVFTPVLYVPHSVYQQMGCTADGDGAIVDNQVLSDGQSVNFGSDLDSRYVVNPVVIDGRTANVTINKTAKGSI